MVSFFGTIGAKKESRNPGFWYGLTREEYFDCIRNHEPLPEKITLSSFYIIDPQGEFNKLSN